MAARNSMKSLLPGINKVFSPSIKEKYGGLRSMTTLAVNNQRPEESSALDVDRGARQAPMVMPVDLLSDPWLGLEMWAAAAPENRGTCWRDEDALRLRVDIPGLSKENVSIRVEGNSLVIKGEAQTDVELNGSGRRYISRIEIPGNGFKLNQIKAEMKNGVLKITVPKVKEEEMKNVINVPIE